MSQQRPSLLLDENISYPIARALRKRGWDAVHNKDLGIFSAPDPEVIETAIKSGRVVVTNDYGDYYRLDKLLREEGREHPGIVLLPRCSISNALERLDQFDWSQVRSTIQHL